MNFNVVFLLSVFLLFVVASAAPNCGKYAECNQCLQDPKEDCYWCPESSGEKAKCVQIAAYCNKGATQKCKVSSGPALQISVAAVVVAGAVLF